MMATRRAVRRSERTPTSARSNESSMCPSIEVSTFVRTTRSKNKVNSHPDIIPESNSEKMKESKTKPDIEEHSEVQATQNRNEATHLVDSVAKLQVDEYVSEADSNCSSDHETPLFIRVTRRRKIVFPCQPESQAKNRQSRRVFPHEDSKCQDDDLSETESCSSAVSGVQTSNAVRMTRSKQVKTNISPVCEVQAEEVSDAESFCSGVSTEPSVQFKRMTRSMRLKLQPETISQSERKSEVVIVEKLPQHITKYQTIVISDSEPTKSDFYEQQASSLSTTECNEQLSTYKPKYDSGSVIGSDLKQRFSTSCKKTDRVSTKTTHEKEVQKDADCEIVDHAEEKAGKNKNIRKSSRKKIPNDIYEIVESTGVMCDQTSEKFREATEKLSPVKSTTTFSQQTTTNKGEHNTQTQKPDTRRLTQSCFHEAEEIIEVDKLHKTSSPPNIIPSQTIESSDDDCRVSVVSIESDGSREEPAAESSLCTKGCSTMSLLISDDSSESDSSDLEETNEMEMIASCAGSRKKNALALDTSDSEELFVIDKTPGLDSSKAYYLEEKDTGNDGEGRKSKTASELEDDEEEFIDEDEGSLDVTTTALPLSSSIDSGLNLKDLGGLYINLDAGKQKLGSHGIVPLEEKKKDELLQKSTVTPDFEKRECVPPLRESVYQLKKKRRAERAKTAGDGWFGMKAPEITNELKNDLQALKMRAAIDPKRFYKKNDREGLPKYFQVGTVVDSPVDFYHARIPKKERKKTIVEELLADAEFRRYNKRKYQDIIAEKAALAAGKKNRKKKKFHK